MSAELDNVNNLHNRNENLMCGVVEGFYGRPWTTEQRRELFKRMSVMGLNTYMYAPKDDYKHRAYWRELYSVEEADLLTSLIDAAKSNNVLFVYALSPGLDITFSSGKEVACLKRKLEQVATFGCKAFALLFDDIEVDMNEADKEIFQSFAHAQVSVTNEVYQHLGQPKFLFCPTEYCASRAVPTVSSSEYLNTLGAKLLPGIEVLWTGPKVISKLITVESIEEIADVIKRPPIIWDNIHANDYDHSRLFLGPYCGRPTELVPCVHGVLTNPNCEFETNFIALHTLAQWSQSTVNKKDCHLSSSPVSSDIKLETEGDEKIGDHFPDLEPNRYIPRRALQKAIVDWMEYVNESKLTKSRTLQPTWHPTVPTPELIKSVNTCLSVTNTTTTTAGITSPNVCNVDNLEELADVAVTRQAEENMKLNDANNLGVDPPALEPCPAEAAMVNAVNSLAQEDKIEPMDCNSSEFPPMEGPTPPPESANDAEMPSAESLMEPLGNSCDKNPDGVKLPTGEDLEIVVDLFYLPFEHGPYAVHLLEEFHWLKTNSTVLKAGRGRRAKTHAIQEWKERAAKFEETGKKVSTLVTRLMNIPNRDLLYDLYPYIWDMKGVISLLIAFTKWLDHGAGMSSSSPGLIQRFYSWCSHGYKDAFMAGEQEPWVYRGGLTAEFQRMLPIDGATDLFLNHPPAVMHNQVYTIRPYLPADEDGVYEVCRKTCDDGLDGTEIFPNYPDLIGDKLVGGLITLSPEYCFVLEDDNGICGYILGALDVKAFYNKLESAWLPELCKKYPKPGKSKSLSPEEEIIVGFHKYQRYLPGSVYTNTPSLVKMNILPTVCDLSIFKRMMACLLSAFKANGSKGAYCEVSIGDKNIINMYTGLRYFQVPNLVSDEVIILARPL